MELLLRKITTDASGVQEYMDSEITRAEILIGSSPQCDIQLLDSGIAAVHARFQRRDGKVQLKSEKRSRFLHNGKAVKQAELQEGDEVRIGSQIFTCQRPAAGFDLALEWQYAELPAHLLANAYRTSLSELRFSPRILSWCLAVSVLVLLGLGPLLDHLWQEKAWQETASQEEAAGDDQVVEQRMRPSKLWQSGPLLPAHQVVLGNDCGACHQSAFVQVEDQACEQCHSDVGDHVLPGHPDLADLGEHGDFDRFSCQNCHKEHNEPQSIVARSDSLCRNCHQDMDPSVEGFTGDTHPPFALSLLQPQVSQVAGTLAVDWQREKSAADAAVEEVSHLNYPHDVHLDEEAVRHPRRDDQMQCADCHSLSSDREHFQPISMERHCASCHDLSFDERNPRKQLPHGSPQAVFDALEAHFVKLAFSEQQGDEFERRRLPGRERKDTSCERDYDCAKQKALREADRQFSQRGCITCHQVEQRPGAEGIERWQVLPVKLNDNWFASANFDHRSHLTQAEQSGSELCLSCHDASDSSTSADVLMPALAACTDCHGDKSVSNRVAVNCIDCHGYHREDERPMPHPGTHFTGGATELLKGVVNGER